MTDEEQAKFNHEFRVRHIANLTLQTNWPHHLAMRDRMLKHYDRTGQPRPTDAEVAAEIERITADERRTS